MSLLYVAFAVLVAMAIMVAVAELVAWWAER